MTLDDLTTSDAALADKTDDELRKLFVAACRLVGKIAFEAQRRKLWKVPGR